MIHHKSFQFEIQQQQSQLDQKQILKYLVCYQNIMQTKISVNITISQKQVHQLLKLQELFHTQYMTEELLNQMIALYVKFVQNIHFNQHPLKIFFLQKIKFVLSSPQISKILEKQGEKQKQNIRQTIRSAGLNMDDQLQIKKIRQQTKQQIRKNHVINLKKQKPHQKDNYQQLKQKQRNMLIDMQMQIMKQVDKQAGHLQKEAYKKQKKAIQQINNIVNKQDQTLSLRRANRKNKLRKKSAQLKDKQVFEQQKKIITHQQLKQMTKQLNQTYQRFTRMTMSKNRNSSVNSREGTGKVKHGSRKIPVQEQIIQNFEETQPQQDKPALNFSKKKKVQQQKVEQKRQQTAIEYKTFEQPSGRVTNRRRQYEQIQQEVF